MMRRLEKIFDKQVRPVLAQHGGDIELVDYDNDILYVSFKGGCQGCSSASATLRDGVEKILREKFPEIEKIVDVTSHADGENPYM